MPGSLIVERNVLEWRFDPASDARLPEATGYDVGVIVLCSEGYTSSLAAGSLRSLGLHRATDVVGGFLAWAAVGLPTTCPHGRTAPLDGGAVPVRLRHAQLAAGSRPRAGTSGRLTRTPPVGTPQQRPPGRNGPSYHRSQKTGPAGCPRTLPAVHRGLSPSSRGPFDADAALGPLLARSATGVPGPSAVAAR